MPKHESGNIAGRAALFNLATVVFTGVEQEHRHQALYCC